MSDKMREALKLADAALSGANMNMAVVKRKISEALAEQPAQGDEPNRGQLKPHDGGSIALGYTAPPAPVVPDAEAMGQAASRHFANLDNGDGTFAFDPCSSYDVDALVAAMLSAAPKVKP